MAFSGATFSGPVSMSSRITVKLMAELPDEATALQFEKRSRRKSLTSAASRSRKRSVTGKSLNGSSSTSR